MKYLNFILIGLLFIFGFILGIVFNDFPFLQLDSKVRLFEPLTFLLTASIGLLIPFFIKRWIEDSRQIKNNLIDELKETLREVSIIKNKVSFCYHTKSIKQRDKQEINILFEESDLKINCLKQQFIESFDIETKTIREEINSAYLDYWKLTTGAELMSSKFKTINENFYSRHNNCFSKFELKIKQAINKIHRI